MCLFMSSPRNTYSPHQIEHTLTTDHVDGLVDGWVGGTQELARQDESFRGALQDYERQRANHQVGLESGWLHRWLHSLHFNSFLY